MTRAQDDASRRARIALALAAVYVFWGTTYVAAKIMVTDLPPLSSAGFRFTIAGLLLAAFARWRGAVLPRTLVQWRHVVLLGVLAVGTSHALQIIALRHVASNQSGLLNATPALWIAWLGTFGARAQPLDGYTRFGLVLGCIGVLLLIGPGGGDPLLGLGWQGVILLGALTWSLATIYQRNNETGLGPMMLSGLQMLVGGSVMMTLGTAAGELAEFHWTLQAALAMLWLIAFSSCAAFTAYSYLIANTTPTVVGSYGYVTPAVAALAGWALLGETLSWAQLAGMLVVLVAVAMAGGAWPRRALNPAGRSRS